MIKTTLTHQLVDMAINAMFDNFISNFKTVNIDKFHIGAKFVYIYAKADEYHVQLHFPTVTGFIDEYIVFQSLHDMITNGSSKETTTNMKTALRIDQIIECI